MLPRGAGGRVDVLTGRSVRGDSFDPAELFATLPIAVLAANDVIATMTVMNADRRMMLHELAAVSAALAATRSRSEKTRLLAECLRALAPDERETGVAWLAGVLPGGKLSLGPGRRVLRRKRRRRPRRR